MTAPLPRSEILRQHPLQVVEALPPAVLVGPHGLLVPQVAVSEADRRDALDLLEVDLDELALGVAVPEPGEGEPARRIDLGVAPAATVLDVLVGIPHHHTHLAAHAQ